MMNKTPKSLKATTIIPDALYVDRDADRQLDAIIDDMGRPGYVLVARQMGKTNLLLKMKRRREASGDLVLYFDLSTRFVTARDLFRHLIDGFVERLDDLSLAARIKEERTALGLEGNAEFDRHVRLALSVSPAPRVVIVLDEIDSLVGHEFSDRILSQIRSMYFARANYEVYERLTYVLSGVAEPTDLIKDKNISPFNIGEKIYLSDFSLSEVFRLLQKAGLNFSTDVIEAVYDWTSGNPRMTWDVCAALEDAERSGELLTPATVEAVVLKLYLTRFDRPPIDHIRAIAENDKQVRSSLITLLYGKGRELDDSARSRLYLAGITGASANEVPKLKNRIIERALSEEWLTQVEAGQRGLADAAETHYREGRYVQSIALYQQFLEEKDNDLTSLSVLQLVQLGLSQYNLSRLADAILTLEVALKAKGRSTELRDTSRYYLASAYLLSGNVAAAIPMFEEIISLEGSFKLQAKHALSGAYISLSIVNNVDTIIQLNSEVLHEVSLTEPIDATSAELKAASHYNLAQVYFATSRRDQGRNEIGEALRSVSPNYLPGLGAEVLDFIDDKKMKKSVLIEAINAALVHEPKISESPNTFALNAYTIGRLLDGALEFGEVELFTRLSDLFSKILAGNLFDQLLYLARHSSDTKTRPLNALLKFILTEKTLDGLSTVSSRLEAIRLWLGGAPEPDNTTAFALFSKEIDGNSELLHQDDIIHLIGRLGTLMHLNKIFEASAVIHFVRSHQDFFLAKAHPLFVLFLQYEMMFNKNLGDDNATILCAREIVRLTTAGRLKGVEIVAPLAELAERVRGMALSELKSRATGPLTGIGRNEQIVVRETSTGNQLTMKFKKAEALIKIGAYEFISKA